MGESLGIAVLDRVDQSAYGRILGPPFKRGQPEVWREADPGPLATKSVNRSAV